MLDSKNGRRLSNCWGDLLSEVQGRRQQQSQQLVSTVDYSVRYQRRRVKYELGEPLSGVYFTQREADCIAQMLQGKTMHQTGIYLELSARTVEYYLDRAKRKMNCRKKQEMIHLVSQTNFMQDFQSDPYNQKREKE